MIKTLTRYLLALILMGVGFWMMQQGFWIAAINQAVEINEGALIAGGLFVLLLGVCCVPNSAVESELKGFLKILTPLLPRRWQKKLGVAVAEKVKSETITRLDRKKTRAEQEAARDCKP